MHLCSQDVNSDPSSCSEKWQLMLTSAHPAWYTGLPAAGRAEFFKYMQKVLNHIKMKVTEIYLREILPPKCCLPSVWSIHLL